MHLDNAPLHRSAVTENYCQSRQFPHPPPLPYSYDIRPCDSLLFADLKTKLKGKEFENGLTFAAESFAKQFDDEIVRFAVA
jgi:hypothetical protein